MKLLETTVTETHVRMLLADADTKDTASQWIELRVLVADLKAPEKQSEPLGDPAAQFLGGVQAAALARAQAVIGDEIRRLRAAARQTF